MTYATLDFRKAGGFYFLSQQENEIKCLDVKISKRHQTFDRIATAVQEGDAVLIDRAHRAFDGPRTTKHRAHPIIKGGFSVRPARHRNGRPGICSHSGIELQCYPVSETQISAPRRIYYFTLDWELSAANGLHHCSRAIEVAQGQLVRAFRGEHIAQRIKAVLKVILFFLDGVDLIGIERRHRGDAKGKGRRGTRQIKSVGDAEVVYHFRWF